MDNYSVLLIFMHTVYVSVMSRYTRPSNCLWIIFEMQAEDPVSAPPSMDLPKTETNLEIRGMRIWTDQEFVRRLARMLEICDNRLPLRLSR